MSNVPWIVAVAGLAIIVWAIWQWRAVPQPLSWRPILKAPPRPKVLNASWIALTGWRLTPNQLRQLNALAAIGVGIVVTLITHNPIMGGAFAVIAFGWPEGFVRSYARRQWTELDKTALSACTSIQFTLEDRRPVLPAWERIHDHSEGVLRRFLEPCLSAEATGYRSFEQQLKESSRAIRHIELQLVADVLTAERQRGQTAELLATVLQLWSQRMEADARRRGQIRAGTMLSKVLLTGSIFGIGILWLTSPSVTHDASHGLGLIAFGVATWLIAAGAWIQRQAERQAEQV